MEICPSCATCGGCQRRGFLATPGRRSRVRQIRRPTHLVADMYFPTESSPFATRTSGIYTSSILSTNVSSPHRRTLPRFAPRSRQPRHSLPLPRLPDHPFSLRDLKRNGGYQALPQVLRRRPDSHPRSADMSFRSSTPVVTNPKRRRLTQLARFQGRMCLADAFVGEEGVCPAYQ